jgi:hypothetical protein
MVMSEKVFEMRLYGLLKIRTHVVGYSHPGESSSLRIFALVNERH